MTDKKFRSIEELRGTTLGVSGSNFSSTLLLHKMLNAHGLSYPRDYTLVEVGGTSDRLAAIKTGATSAGVVIPPISDVAAEQGFKILGELRNYIPAVQFTALSVRRAVGLSKFETHRGLLACSAARQPLCVRKLLRNAGDYS